MKAQFYMDPRQVKALLERIARQTGQSTVELLHSVMELWAKDLVRETYPKKRAEGVQRVAKDVRQVFGSEAQFQDDSIRASFKRGSEWDMANPRLLFRPRMQRDEMRQEHEAQRNRRGRINRGTRTGLIVSERELKRYIKDRQRGVGRLKAGWAAVAARYRLALPSWVAQHGIRESGFEDRLNRQTLDGELEASNAVPYAEQKLGGAFMDFLLSKRVTDLKSGFYAKRWQKQVERATARGAA